MPTVVMVSRPGGSRYVSDRTGEPIPYDDEREEWRRRPRSRMAEGEPLTVSRPQLLVRGNDEAFRQFVHDTLAFASRIQTIRNALGSVIHLSGTQYTILIAIAREQLSSADFNLMRHKTPLLVDSADRAIRLFEFMSTSGNG